MNGHQLEQAQVPYLEGAGLQAASVYLDKLRQSPDDADALLRLGNISESSGDFEDAEFFYQKYLELRPADTAVRQRLARVWMRQPVAPAQSDQPAPRPAPAKAPAEREVRIEATVRLVESTYTEQSEWFRLNAKDKADHVISLCRKNGLAPAKVLEVGAGGGAILSCLDRAGFAPELHALEISRSGVEVIRQQQLPSVKQVAVFDGYRTPYADQEFDLVILSHVLEHVEYERLLLRELQRISRHQVIEIPLDYSEEVDGKWLHYASYGHINIYNPSLLRFLLATERFQLVDELAAPYSLEVIQYIHFENSHRARTPEGLAEVAHSYDQHCRAVAAMPAREREKHASSYTVLTRRMTDADLFEHHLQFATRYHQQDRHGDAELILKSLRSHGLENFAPLPNWAKEQLAGIP